MMNLGYSLFGVSSLDMSRNDSGGELVFVFIRSFMYFVDMEESEVSFDLVGFNSLYR